MAGTAWRVGYFRAPLEFPPRALSGWQNRFDDIGRCFVLSGGRARLVPAGDPIPLTESGPEMLQVAMAAVAAVPGFIDWAFGVPSDSPARRHGLVHLALNVAALILFLINLIVHLSAWNVSIHPHTAAGAILALLGVLCTIGAGFFGWTMIQDDHVGVRPL